MIEKLFSLGGLFRLAILVAVSALPAAAADGIADFYKGKQMRVVVGSEPGGGYDLYARLVAQHLGRFIPGNPTFIVQNQPGAGSITAANLTYVQLPQDGTVIVALQASALFEQMTGNPAAQFEAGKFHWLGSLNSEPGIAVTWHGSKIRTFDDLVKEPSNFGTSGPNVTEQYSSLLIHLTGAKIKQIAGYPSATATYLPIERGELDGLTSSWGSIKASNPHWIRENKVNLLVQFALTKQPDIPNVPLILDLLTDKYLAPGYRSEEANAIWRIVLTQQSMARPYGLGPGVSTDRVAALRKAFKEMAQDKEFLAQAEKQKRDISLFDGETVQKLILDAAKTPKATLEKVDVVTKPKQ